MQWDTAAACCEIPAGSYDLFSHPEQQHTHQLIESLFSGRLLTVRTRNQLLLRLGAGRCQCQPRRDSISQSVLTGLTESASRVYSPDCRCWRQHFGNQSGEFVLQSIKHNCSHTAPAEILLWRVVAHGGRILVVRQSTLVAARHKANRQDRETSDSSIEREQAKCNERTCACDGSSNSHGGCAKIETNSVKSITPLSSVSY